MPGTALQEVSRSNAYHLKATARIRLESNRHPSSYLLGHLKEVETSSLVSLQPKTLRELQ